MSTGERMAQPESRGALRGLWDLFFGPPRIRELEDGTLRVRILGRVHEGRDHEELFFSVNRERERLIQSVGKVRDGSHARPDLMSSRFGVGEVHHREIQRLQDRLGVYNDFLGHLVRMLPEESVR